MPSFIDASGMRQEIDLTAGTGNHMHYHELAAREKISFRQAINRAFPTQAGQPDAFRQMCASAGLRFRKDEDLGTPAANLRDILNPEAANQVGGSNTTFPQVPDSRILFPAALLEAVEGALNTKEDEATNAFESLVGYTETIASDRFEQPVISYGGNQGPEKVQFQRVAQNARPPLMLSLTASDYTRTIPTTAIGMEISAKALMFNSLDLVARTMTRFLKKANYAEWITQIGLILSGDLDAVNTPMATCKSALSSITATSLDSTIASAAGVLSQKAWLAFMYRNIMKMQKTHMVCDFASAISLEVRTNRPTNVMNNSVDRLDVPYEVIYPILGKSIKVLIMPVGTFTANTLMAMDQQYALAKVISSSANYDAIDNIIMKRSTELRIDRGFVVYRQYDDAFDTMTLT